MDIWSMNSFLQLQTRELMNMEEVLRIELVSFWYSKQMPGFCIEVAKEVRANWPQNKPLFIRLSCHEWVEGIQWWSTTIMADGFNIEQTIQLVKLLKDSGVDLVDCSSGGNSLSQKIAVGPGYQVLIGSSITSRSPSLKEWEKRLVSSPQQLE